ncbi:hypothetical protein Hanom_Chr13g01235651 [Helianthus anomalus]
MGYGYMSRIYNSVWGRLSCFMKLNGITSCLKKRIMSRDYNQKVYGFKSHKRRCVNIVTGCKSSTTR